MTVRNLLFFVGAILLFLGAANWRPGDSAHAMGLLSLQGGKALHPYHLGADESRYALVATATVLPPLRGDVRVVVEGSQPMKYLLVDSAPALELGWHHRPRLEEGTFRDLAPFDRLAFWVLLAPPGGDPTPLPWPHREPQWAPVQLVCHGGFRLAFYREESSAPLLSIPIHLGAPAGDCHE